MIAPAPKAALLIIGNEILSGRTQDANLQYIAKELGKKGVRFAEVRVIPDIEETIISVVNELRKNYDYLFTTGGIGPTHDDITTASVAKAFGVPLERHEETYRIMEEYYASRGGMNEGRTKMTLLPRGAEPITNPVSAAPGIHIGNVYVMAGIPNVMRAMFDSFSGSLVGGAVIQAHEVRVYIAESKIAAPLEQLQQRYPDLDIGSYPFVDGVRFGTSLVLRGTDTHRIQAAAGEMEAFLAELGATAV